MTFNTLPLSSSLSPAPQIEPHGLPKPGSSALDELDAAVVPRVDAVGEVVDAARVLVGLRHGLPVPHHAHPVVGEGRVKVLGLVRRLTLFACRISQGGQVGGGEVRFLGEERGVVGFPIGSTQVRVFDSSHVKLEFNSRFLSSRHLAENESRKVTLVIYSHKVT